MKALYQYLLLTMKIYFLGISSGVKHLANLA